MNRRSGPNRTLGLLALLAVSGFQSSMAFRLEFHGAQPDFPLALVLTAALLSGAEFGSIAGFACGLVSAGLAGQTLGTYLVTRTLAGFLVGWLAGRFLRINLGIVVAGVFFGTLIAEGLFGLSSPRIGLLGWLRVAVIGGAMNALLAVPFFFLLRRLGWEPS